MIINNKISFFNKYKRFLTSIKSFGKSICDTTLYQNLHQKMIAISNNCNSHTSHTYNFQGIISPNFSYTLINILIDNDNIYTVESH